MECVYCMMDVLPMQTLFVGVGADEQLAGYSRHRTKFRYVSVVTLDNYFLL